jgi:hypothetical protein
MPGYIQCFVYLFCILNNKLFWKRKENYNGRIVNLEATTCIHYYLSFDGLMKKQRTTKTLLQPKCSLKLKLVIVIDLLDKKSLT